ncbi:hypothetical protein DL98DRAFT_662420 [Cadophora sp. DSE1049]|nr:hypothetical protein DL98DRAFT_662420 [Cadophora sp. DSE1049]
MADSDQETQEDPPSCSDPIEHTSQPTNSQKVRSQPSETTGIVIDLTGSDSEAEAEAERSRDLSMAASSTRIPSKPLKRSFKAADDEVGDQAASHKRRKVDENTALPDSLVSLPQDVRASGNKPNAPPKRNIRPKFGERSLKDSMDTELEWLNSAKKSSEKFCRLSLDRTGQLSKFIEFETETTDLLDAISAEDRPQQIREYIHRLRKVEARRRGISDEWFRNTVADYGECAHLKQTVERWILKETKVSRRIERC